MSRVGKNPIEIPEGVKVELGSRVLAVLGNNGRKEVHIHDDLAVDIADSIIKISLKNDTKYGRMLWGTTQRNIMNAVKGYKTPFQVRLTLNGVGYKAQVKGNKLVLSLGYSHDVEYDIPEGVNIKCEKPTLVVISGCDKDKVGQTAAEIQSVRSTEPYKGKGVYPEGKEIYRKEGKKN